MRNPLLLLTFAVLFFVACKKESDKGPYSKKADVAYGSDPKQVMDLYLPTNGNSNNTKLMILIHGGAWVEGDKAEFDVYITALQKRLPGYAFANLNYRLYGNNGQNKFPAQEEDVRAAVGYLMSKHGELKFSKEFILVGASAGGHLALLQGYKYAGEVKPKAIISFFGPTDFQHLYEHPVSPLVPGMLAGIIGGTPSQRPDLYTAYSPIHFVTASSAPTLLLQGGKDGLVPPAQATRLVTKLEDAGVAHEYIFYPEEAHGWTGAALDDSFNKIEAFIRKQVP